MASAIACWQSGQGYPGIFDDRFSAGPAWNDAVSYLTLIFMSMSMGFQGVMSIRLKTNSGATLPLTTAWLELCGAQALFKLNKFSTARDQRILGIVSVFIGRGLTFRLGSPGALGVALGLDCF
ncbi:hypothetical protein D9757_001696 [Collybiopsis confluens]|uniref:Uncharacterized protein n=1 Tax=Collybiopsis confluens TaxID=2823264 RepID=A0A8H5MFH0_9AGAR|nr:hypothetical protein D9757_001696 [Collybiopsis confluens]